MKCDLFLLNLFMKLSLIAASFPLTLHPKTYAPAYAARFASDTFGLNTGNLDPLYIDFIQINNGGVKLNLYNIQISGLKNTIIKSVRIDKTSKLMRLTFLVDYTLKSQYNVAGNIFSVPVLGNGELSRTNTYVEMDMIMPFEIIKDVYGRDVIDLKGYQYSFDVKRAGNFLLTNSYYGDKLSSDRLLTLLNQKWKLPAEYEKERVLYDKMNDKIFNVIRSYLLSQPLDTIIASMY